jgi:hypothetical protein
MKYTSRLVYRRCLGLNSQFALSEIISFSESASVLV